MGPLDVVATKYYIDMWITIYIFDLKKKSIRTMHIATGPEPVAKGPEKSCSGHILSKNDFFLLFQI